MRDDGELNGTTILGGILDAGRAARAGGGDPERAETAEEGAQNEMRRIFRL